MNNLEALLRLRRRVIQEEAYHRKFADLLSNCRRELSGKIDNARASEASEQFLRQQKMRQEW